MSSSTDTSAQRPQALTVIPDNPRTAFPAGYKPAHLRGDTHDDFLCYLKDDYTDYWRCSRCAAQRLAAREERVRQEIAEQNALDARQLALRRRVARSPAAQRLLDALGLDPQEAVEGLRVLLDDNPPPRVTTMRDACMAHLDMIEHGHVLPEHKPQEVVLAASDQEVKALLLALQTRPDAARALARILTQATRAKQ